MDVESLKRRIAELEAEVRLREEQAEALTKLDGAVCLRPVGNRKKSSRVQVLSFVPNCISDRRRQVEDFCRDLVINNDHISKMEKRLRQAIAKGLNRETHQAASVKCFPTFVRELPSGKEVGKFLALDLGGTNFRVILMTIGDNAEFEMESEIFPVPEAVMLGPGEGLFDHIAACLASFVNRLNIKEKLPLGFTFSFACQQVGLAKGILTKWTKGFKCSGVEGEDVVAMLVAAIERRDDVSIDVAALLNDTTGCLMSCAWQNPKCRIGLIIGTGTNACYLEHLDHVGTWTEEVREPKYMIINTEWGAFGEQGELDFILTKWDRAIDANSINPGAQIFEKMISGMYMGEVVRHVLVDLMAEGLIFSDGEGEKLEEKGAFLTRFVSEIESDPVGDFTRCRAALAELGINYPSEEDCSALRYVCECVSRRAGFIVSAGVAALLKRMDYKDVVVAVDGSVFRHHPHFPNIVRSRICQLMGIDYKFDLMLSTDGSGRGAALVAAVLCGECRI